MSKRYPFFITLAVIFAAVLTFTACNATGSIGGSGDIPTPAGPVHVEIRATLNRPGTFSMNNATGLCLELTFFDKAGAKLGSTTLTAGPNSGTVPAGTEKWSATTIDCPEELIGERVDPPESYIVFGMPINFDSQSDTHNAVYSFVVNATNSEEARRIADFQIRRPIGAPIDSRISVVVLYQTIVGRFAVSVVSTSQSRPSVFDLTVNDSEYATLRDGAVVGQHSTGLWQIEAPVFYGDINRFGYWNEVQIQSATVEDPNVRTTDVRMIYSR